MLLAMFALWRLPLGRRFPELLTFAVLAIVQIEIAWMITRTTDAPVPPARLHARHLRQRLHPGRAPPLDGGPRRRLGARAGRASGSSTTGRCASTTSWRSSCSWAPRRSSPSLAHLRRYALNTRELITRVRLEREQLRTGVLLSQLERLSHEDPLTGLANRRRWDAELASALHARPVRTAAPVAVVLLDIDHFKTVNDRHGHAGGDEVLREVAGC